MPRSLACFSAQTHDSSIARRAPESVVKLLDALAPSPAYVLGLRWDFLAWNEPFARLYPPIEMLAPEDRNLVWVMFGEPLPGLPVTM